MELFGTMASLYLPFEILAFATLLFFLIFEIKVFLFQCSISIRILLFFIRVLSSNK